jgi:uncharacterized protein
LKRIGLLSDTHGYLDESIFGHLNECDEIWHAGDFGNISLVEALRSGSGKLIRGVWGNIDGQDIRAKFPEKLHFTCEKVPVFIKHIGGYPGKYAPGVKNEIRELGARLFISGHSHILKIMYDKELDCLHINPGAAGKQGWQQVRTIVRFVIDGDNIRDCEVIELS